MYCERYKCTMGEATCIARQRKEKRPRRKTAYWVADDLGVGCSDCAQGDEIYKQYLKDKKMDKKKNKKMANKKEVLKICAHCQQNKPADLEHFYKDSKSKDGLGSWCIECQKLSSKESNEKKGGIVPKKKEKKSILSFMGGSVSDMENCLFLDFKDHPDLFEYIESTAKLNFRSPGMQVMWCLSMDQQLHVQGEE